MVLGYDISFLILEYAPFYLFHFDMELGAPAYLMGGYEFFIHAVKKMRLRYM